MRCRLAVFVSRLLPSARPLPRGCAGHVARPTSLHSAFSVSAVPLSPNIQNVKCLDVTPFSRISVAWATSYIERRWFQGNSPESVEAREQKGKEDDEHDTKKTDGCAHGSVSVGSCWCDGTTARPRKRIRTNEQSGPGHSQADSTGAPLRLAERET